MSNLLQNSFRVLTSLFLSSKYFPSASLSLIFGTAWGENKVYSSEVGAYLRSPWWPDFHYPQIKSQQSWNAEFGAALTHEWHMGFTNTLNLAHAYCCGLLAKVLHFLFLEIGSRAEAFALCVSTEEMCNQPQWEANIIMFAVNLSLCISVGCGSAPAPKQGLFHDCVFQGLKEKKWIMTEYILLLNTFNSYCFYCSYSFYLLSFAVFSLLLSFYC